MYSRKTPQYNHHNWTELGFRGWRQETQVPQNPKSNEQIFIIKPFCIATATCKEITRTKDSKLGHVYASRITDTNYLFGYHVF